MMQRIVRTNSYFAYVCVHRQALALNTANNRRAGQGRGGGTSDDRLIGGVALLARVTEAEFLAGNAACLYVAVEKELFIVNAACYIRCE